MFATRKEITVLFVEDDFLTREALKEVLEKFYTVLTAEDGIDGFDIFVNTRVDLVITDIRMPRLDGIGMARKIKEISANTPIAILSAHTDYEHLIDAIEIDINEYILKPVKTQKLLEKLDKIANKIVLAKQVEDKNKQLLAYSKFVAMGEILQMIAHQWRQPITSISSILQSLAIKDKMGKLQSEDIQNSVSFAKDITKNLSDTIDNFNSLFSMDKDKTTCNLSLLIDRAISLIELDIKSRNIDIFKDMFFGDDVHILKNNFVQVILNILKNAEDALVDNSINNPYIKITTNQSGEYVSIEIEDNAGGINDNIIDKIFEPYFSTKSKNGKGLGLYMAKIVTENYLHGTLSVKNGEYGAIFKINIPILKN